MSRVGYLELADDGTGCCGQGADLVSTAPVVMHDGGITDAEDMFDPTQDIDYFPNPGITSYPATSFADLMGGTTNGIWSIFVGDAVGADAGSLAHWSISFSTCDAGTPSITGFSNLSHHGTTINWSSDALPAGGSFVVRYHEFGNSPNFSWMNIAASQGSAYVNGLDPDTRYVFRVGARCPGQTMANYSDTASVLTKKFCTPPTGMSSTPSATSAIVQWDDVSAYMYKVRLREVGSGTWSSRTTFRTNSFFDGLASSTDYEWQVRSVCNDGGNKAYGTMQTFSTLVVRMASEQVSASFEAFGAYPNPTSDNLKIRFMTDKETQATLELRDMSGRIVLSSNISCQLGANNTYVDMSNFPKGVYLVRLMTRDMDTVVSERVVKN